MSYLSVDFETRSTVDLRETSVYCYATHPTTDIWCMAWAIEGGPVQLWTPGDPIPEELGRWVKGGQPVRAWNAMFERIIWRFILHRNYGFPNPDLEQFYCTQAEAYAMNLPASLAMAAKVLGLVEQKDKAGRRLMLQMAKPRRIEDDGVIVWWDVPEKRQRLYEYCKQDVRTERAIARKIRPLGDDERATYLLDQKINDRGVMVDMPLVCAMDEMQAVELDSARSRLETLTDGRVTTANQIQRMMTWIEDRGADIPDLQKSTVREVLEGDLDGIPSDVVELLRIRQDVGRSSVKKVQAILNGVNSDGRARGLLQYHGAGTGRWAGRGIQPQNLPRPEVGCAEWCASEKDEDAKCDCGGVERFIPAVLERDVETIESEGYGVMEVLSSLLRSTLIAAPGHRLIGVDYSQIEARVTAWYAGQDDLLEVFRQGGKVYEEQASAIYGIPVEEIDKDSFERQVGKEVVLGCGFQMGARKFSDRVYEATGIRIPARKKYDDDPKEADRIIAAYREKNWRIANFWNEIEHAAISAVVDPGTVYTVGRNDCIKYVQRGPVLWCVLPSGRPLAYCLPSIQPRTTPWGEEKPSLTFCGINSYSRKWQRMALYGGWLTENVVQAAARDLLRDAMHRCEEAGYKVILTVHDEILLEVPEGFGSLEEAEALIAEVPPWAAELSVAVEGWEGRRYRK